MTCARIRDVQPSGTGTSVRPWRKTIGTSTDGLPPGESSKGQLSMSTPSHVKPFDVPFAEPAVAGATDANRSACLQSRRHVTKPPREKPVRWFFLGSVRKTSATFWMILTTFSSSAAGGDCHVLPGPPGHGDPVGATTMKPRCLPSAFRLVFASISAPVPVSPWSSVMRPQPGFAHAAGIDTSVEKPSHVKV